jgi:hypothetical protein
MSLKKKVARKKRAKKKKRTRERENRYNMSSRSPLQHLTSLLNDVRNNSSDSIITPQDPNMSVKNHTVEEEEIQTLKQYLHYLDVELSHLLNKFNEIEGIRSSKQASKQASKQMN